MTATVVWYRRDFRLADHQAMAAAIRRGGRVVPVYIHAPEEEDAWPAGSASRWWLHHTLAAFDASLRELGSRLVIRRGSSAATLLELCREAEADTVMWSRLYEPAAVKRDGEVAATLDRAGIAVESFNAALLYEPWEVAKASGDPYKVFTPFWKALLRMGMSHALWERPPALPPVGGALSSVPLDALDLLPKVSWDAGFHTVWQPGEAGGHTRLGRFLEDGLADYREGRDRPDRALTSRLSPHLHFGEIGPRQIIRALEHWRRPDHSAGLGKNLDCFVRELAWREFAHHILFHFPHTAEKPLDPRFDGFPWMRDYGAALRRWQQGQTGYPLVDAGMRQLWRTGWMHNRVRMVVASFLTKNLRIPWIAGARWFWDTLVDADLANNSFGWQWSAGCGADAAPYFRVFNPVLQGERFDPEGIYVRRWVPELAGLPATFIHKPWTASARRLSQCGVILGVHYPEPLVDLRASREDALSAFRSLTRAV